MTDCEAQKEELLALQSIYEREFERTSECGGKIRVCLELPGEFKVTVKAGELHRQYDVCFLPAELNFDLPVDYPSVSSPVFTLSCNWLSPAQRSEVQQHLHSLWQEGQGGVVLFTWAQFLKEDLLPFLHIQSTLQLHWVTDGAPEARQVQNDILLELLEFDFAQKRRVFDTGVYTCNVCLVEKLGSDCVMLHECQHVHCKVCMAEFFTLRIKEGNVFELKCPEPSCSSMATTPQVKDLVSQEAFARYDRLLLQSSLDAMGDVTYCPRQSCAAPVVLEPNGNNSGLCPVCYYAFCSKCRGVYHGISRCKTDEPEEENEEQGATAPYPQREAGLKQLWLDYDTGSKERKKLLESRYGKAVFKARLVDILTHMWKKQNTKECPTCKTDIEKNGGCNHMYCTFCGQGFDWGTL